MKTFRRPRSRTNTRVVRRSAIGLAAIALVASSGTMSAFADHPEVSLTGSAFEIDTDADLLVEDDAPSLDWANVDENRRQDSPSGSGDESFGQGTKEDTAVPKVVSGGIPPNKSDLKYFGVYQEGTSADGFLNLFWARVQDPSGTTNMDFELNKLRCTPGTEDEDCSANDLTPKRSSGDLLVIYDLSQGGTHPTLSLRTWTGTAWGTVHDLTSSGTATGSINSNPIAAEDSDDLGAQDPRTFGEAQIDLSEIFGSGCSSFGSVYLKSRSSDSFTAALKDFVPPQPVDITNCVPASLTSAQSWVPNDSVTVSASSGGNLAGSVSFALYPSTDCTGTAIYDTGANPVPVSGASPQTVSSANTTAVTATGSYSWQVSFASTNSKQLGIAASCKEVSALTIDNDNTD
jgi:hypothetical protein